MGYLSHFVNAACDGCGKIMSVEEAHRADNASEFIWFCDSCRGYPGAYQDDECERE